MRLSQKLFIKMADMARPERLDHIRIRDNSKTKKGDETPFNLLC